MRTLLALALLAAGCAPTITVVATNPSPRPLIARPARSVEIYTTRLPYRPYVEVAVLSAAKGRAGDHIGALRESAASHGCDALVFTVMPSQQNTTHYDPNSGDIPGTNTSTAVGSSSATCVVWSAPTEAPLATAPR